MGFFSGRRKPRDDEPVDLDERSPQLGLKHKDLLVLKALLDHGADLDQPRHVLHFSYFPTSAAAASASAELHSTGWPSEVSEPLPDFPDQWSVRSERHDVVVTPQLVRESTDHFERVALAHGGSYDGWEASV